MLITALGVYSLILLMITVVVVTNLRKTDCWHRDLNEREALIERREALYEANKREAACIISFLIKQLNEQGAKHDK